MLVEPRSSSRKNRVTDPYQSPKLVRLAMFAPALLYALGLNPWFVPEQHDDVLYYFGAVSLLEGNGFSLGSVPITDWPPVLSGSLAAVMAVFGQSVWGAKAFVFLAVIAGIALVERVARSFELPNPALVAALTALLPVSLISGVSILSEWPYLVASMGFFLALRKLSETRLWRWALIAGALLAIASLTRFLGVFLGAAIIAQAISQARKRGFVNLLPELAVAGIGSVFWLGWKARCQMLIDKGSAPSGAYDQAGYYLERFTHFEPLELFSKIESVLFSFGKAASALFGLEVVKAVVGIAVGAILLIGVVLRWRSRKLNVTDAYVGVCLLLLLGDINKPERYFVPLAPFLLGNFIFGARALVERWQGDRARSILTTCSALWIAWLCLLGGHLLLVGNLDKTRGGFSMLANPTVEDYYRGESLDLYQAVRWADANAPEGAIATVGFHGKYVLAFAGRPFRSLPDEDADNAVALIAKGVSLPNGWVASESFGNFTVAKPGATTP